MNEPLISPAFNAKDDIFLRNLKASTNGHHRQLEAQPLLQSLMQPGVTVDQYCAYLLGMKEITQKYERVVIPMLSAWLPWLATQSSSQLIEQDLEELKSFISNSANPPSFSLELNPVSLSFAWAFAYVMEGSKLGGKMIYSHLKKSLNVIDNEGLRYLSANGIDTGMQWKNFLQQMTLYAAGNTCEEEIIDGAIFSFNAIGKYFEDFNP